MTSDTPQKGVTVSFVSEWDVVSQERQKNFGYVFFNALKHQKMKPFIKVIKFIFVVPVTLSVLWLINLGIFNFLDWFITLSNGLQWLFGSLILCIGGMAFTVTMWGVSRLFKVGKINSYIISILILIDGILWIVDVWKTKYISESLEAAGVIVFVIYFSCNGVFKATENGSFIDGLNTD